MLNIAFFPECCSITILGRFAGFNEMQNVLDLENCTKEFISHTCISLTGKLTVVTDEF